MKLTQEHKKILRDMGVDESDFAQIQEATTKTTYTLYNQHDYSKSIRIGIKEAKRLLGIETYLSGISRSAFHFTCSRQVKNTDLYVSFDSSKLFR